MRFIYPGRFNSQSLIKLGIVSLATIIAYILSFIWLFPRIGSPVGSMAVLPVALTAWLLGLRIGVLNGILMHLLNGFLFTTVGWSPENLFIRSIPSFITLAQLESGKVKLKLRSFEVAQIIEPVRTQMMVLSEIKGLHLVTTVDPDLPAILLGDLGRLRQIIINLVGNAIKFTERGIIKVQVCRVNDSQWSILVSDTGPGIPLQAQTHIFKPFEQVDTSLSSNHKGTGLGLSIVDQLTRLMAGQISLESQLDQGSTFKVILPLITPPEQS